MAKILRNGQWVEIQTGVVARQEAEKNRASEIERQEKAREKLKMERQFIEDEFGAEFDRLHLGRPF